MIVLNSKIPMHYVMWEIYCEFGELADIATKRSRLYVEARNSEYLKSISVNLIDTS